MAMLTLTATGCVQIDGGAVELSWSIRNFAGQRQACAIGGELLPELAFVRICWEPLPDGGVLDQLCDPTRSARFRCGLEHGVTGFEIDRGDTAIWIEPVCDDGDLPVPALYEVPPPIVREIAVGDVATLQALLIVAAPEACLRGGSH
jgi:hypothetical protein